MNERQINGREYLEQEVRLRAHHETAEQVRTTCSFARAERLIGREYHGRFLIELLQNAADAWRNDLRSAGGDRSRVAVFIADGPALVVANQGACMGAEVVIESLGHIGASTKSEGEAIGHKGIGFKSVLEITLTPEIYSGLQKEQPTLAVKFDPDLAISTILDASSDWPRLVSDVQGIDFEDELAAVPVLRFPHWIDDIPAVVKDLKCKGFDTVVRLPFNEKYATRLGLDKNDWLTTVRGALAGVSDQILLLLGCFSEMLVEDRLKSQRDVVTPKWDVNAEPYGEMCTREVVHILRNSEPSSHWRVFRKTFGESKHLAGEIAVGIRINNTLDQIAMLPAIDVEPSAPFHLFFPTRIASGLPFLLHGYFEVDVSRTGFYRGSASRNGAILDELAALTAYAVRNIAESGDVDLVTLVDLVAAASQPEDPLARKFYEKVFEHLDEIDWVPVEAEGADQQSDRPTKLFVCSPNLTRKIASVFSSTYIKRRIGLSLPDIRLSNDAFELVRSRQPVERRDQWATLEKLFRPGKIPIWEDREAGLGFKHLLDLLVALEADDNTAAKALIDGLRGDTDSRLLPTVSPDGGYTFLPVPDPSESVSGRRSRLIMARARTMTGETLVPPHELDLAFLPEGLLESEADIDRAKPLGVRPFTVDNVLDRLNGIADANIDHTVLFRFLWRFLHRERNSAFGTRRSAERALIFDPNEWFWCRPGRAREDDYARLSQQRERYLANVPVPCRDGEWRPAKELSKNNFPIWAPQAGTPCG